MNTSNDFNRLSAEDSESPFAVLSPAEHKEFQDWIDNVAFQSQSFSCGINPTDNLG